MSINFSVNIDTGDAFGKITQIQDSLKDIKDMCSNDIYLNMNTNDVNKELNNTNSILGNIKNSINSIKDGWGEFKSGIQELGGLLDTLITPAIQNFEDNFESFRKFNTLFQGNNTELSNNIDMFQTLGSKLGISASKLADMGYEYLSAGGNKNNLEEFLKSTGTTAQVGNVTNFGQYARTVQSVINNLGIDMNNMSKEQANNLYYNINNAIISVKKRGIMSTEEYAQYASKILPNAIMAGLNFADFNAMMTVDSRVTNNAAKTATGLNGFISNISKQSQKQLGGQNFYNVDVSQRTLKEKGPLQYFKDIKKAIEDAGDVVDTTSLSRLFTNVNSASFATRMIQNLEDLGEETDKYKQNYDELEGMMESYNKNPLTKWQEGIQNLKNAFTNLGETIIPTLTKIIDKITNVITKIKNLVQAFPGLTSSVLKFVAAGTAAVVVMTTLSAIFKVLHGIILIVKGVILGISAVITAFRTGSIIPTITSMLQWIGVIGAVVYAIWFLKKNFGSVGNGILSMVKMIGGGILTLAQFVLLGVQTLCAGLTALFTNLDVGKKAINLFGEVMGIEAAKNFEGFANMLNEPVQNTLKSAIDTIGTQRDKLYKEVEDNLITDDIDLNPVDDLMQQVEKIKKALNVDENGNENYDGNGGGVDWGSFGDNNNDGGISTEDYNKMLEDLKNNDALKEQEEAIRKYNNAIDSLADSFKQMTDNFRNATGMFEKSTKKIVNATTLLNRAKDRAKQQEELQTVKNKLLNSSLLSEQTKTDITQMTVSNLAELKALANMTDSQLKQWDSYNSINNKISNNMSNDSTIRIEFEDYTKTQNIKPIVEQIYKELTRRGVKIN